jgi:hypothetical protein
MVDNFCDVAHFPFVHAGTIGADTDPVVAAISVEQLDADFTGYEYNVDVRVEHGDIVRQRMSTSFHLPFVVRSNTFYESGARAGHDRVLLLCSTPVDEVTSLFTFVVWRNHDHDVPADDVLEFDRAIGARTERCGRRSPVCSRSTTRRRSACAPTGCRSNGADDSRRSSTANPAAALRSRPLPVRRQRPAGSTG